MTYEFEPACRRMEWLDPFYKAVWEKAFAEAIPISGTFELTPRCNFDCKMCYVHLKEKNIPKYGKELSAEEWLDIAEQAKKEGTTWLCITGGEPLMHPEFERIWEGLTKMGFFITLQTNASLIRGRYLEILEEYPPRAVKTTLYGADDQVYKDVCGIEYGFTKVDEGIRNLKKLQIPIYTVTTIIRQNQKDIKNIAYYAFKNKLPWQATGGVKKSVRGAENPIEEVRVQEEQDSALKQSVKYYLENRPLTKERKPCTYCKDYRLGYWITWNGKMRFCSFMKSPDFSVKDLGFTKAWKSLVNYEDELDWPEECKQCKAFSACFKCAGMLEAESGNIKSTDTIFCEKIKQYYHELLKKGE